MAERLDHLIDQIKVRGERLTPQRRLVLEALCSMDSHATIHAIKTYLQTAYARQDMHDSTIYRILQWLKTMHVVTQTDLGTGDSVYELIQRPHHHLICLACGAVTELADDYWRDLRQRIQDDYAFVAHIDHMAIYGYCRGCAQAASADQ